MIINKETVYTKDVANKKLTVTREFDAPVQLVWRAWTESDLLDQWWGPRPWKARTKAMDFREGGNWLYAMVGPQGEEHWCRVNFHNIEATRRFGTVAFFCDENGNKNVEMPVMYWTINFSQADDVTKVNVVLKFDSEAELEKIIEMGFKEGLAAAHTNLDELLAEGLA
jgi:uncharacterized protein YndB with AHSA1/START domain